VPGYRVPAIREQFPDPSCRVARNPTENAVEALPTVDAGAPDGPDARVGVSLSWRQGR
jgi:hypothetical protein